MTRYWSFVVSAMPVVATYAYLLSSGHITQGWKSLPVFLLAVLGAVVLHAAGNVLSDWADYRSGVDNENAYAVQNLVFHRFEPREYLIFSIILFIIGCAAGLAACLLSTPLLLVIGGIGVVLTILYSWLKYHALGDLDIFIIFGVLTVLGTTVALTGDIVPQALVLSLPIGIITVSVLHANNTYDTESDRSAGIKTFAMLIGLKASAILYQAYMILPFACIICAVIAGRLPSLTLLSLIAAIPAWKNFRQAGTYKTAGLEAMKGLDQASAQMQLVFSGMLSLTLFISSLL